MSKPTLIVTPVSGVFGLAAPALGQVEMEWVVVGDPGNIGELAGEGAGA